MSDKTDFNKGTTPTKPTPLDEKTIQKAIEAGAELIKQGEPKIEAAMAIFKNLETQPQEVVVEAFIMDSSGTSYVIEGLGEWGERVCRPILGSRKPNCSKSIGAELAFSGRRGKDHLFRS